MKRMLMVTPVWPPWGSIGVRRVVRLARLLPSLGWAPVVLTDAPAGSGRANAPVLDETLVAPPVEVHRVEALMPGARLRRAVIARLGDRLGHLFFRATNGLPLPDHYPEWTLAAVRAARRLAPVDVVWSTGGPFGAFVVAAAVARALDRPLVLDYRDLWTQAGQRARNPLRWPKAVQRRLEGALLARAAGVAYVNAEMLALNEAAFARPADAHWVVIPNGYEPSELAAVEPLTSERPVLLYAGNCYGGITFAPVVHALAAGFGPGEKGLQIQYFGAVDPRGLAALAAHDLAGRVEVHRRVPAAEIAPHLKGAAALLLIGDTVNTHALTGKVFDYIAAGRPVLGVGPPDAPLGRFVRAAGLGVWVDAADQAGIIAALRAAEAGTLPYAPRAEVLYPYTAQAMAERTAALLDAVVAA